jgi:hypothetical protein
MPLSLLLKKLPNGKEKNCITIEFPCNKLSAKIGSTDQEVIRQKGGGDAGN